MYGDFQILLDRLAIPDNSQDSMVTASAEWAQAFINGYTHRTFAACRETRLYGPEALDCSLSSGQRYRASRTLILDEDLLAVYLLTNGDGSTIPSGGYVLEPRNQRPHYLISLTSAYWWYWPVDGWVSVLGDWGYTDEPPEPIIGCAYKLAEFHYRSRFTVAKPQPVWLGVLSKGSQLPEGFPSDVFVALDPFVKLAR